MNRGHIQSERAASAQRDLFDTQLRIEDQLIEQKSEMHHPGALSKVVTAALQKPGAKWTPETGWTDQPIAPAGPTVRTLTDTFNSKL